uniref:DUF4283 domain-containing protein n=1 Tax=Quercus lobata TaxID=97700 RepID=A0A7N2LMQ7_QUELO
MWETFSLSESEGSKYRVCESGVEGPYLLAAWFFMGRVLSMEAIARTFKLLWYIKKGFEVKDMGNHCVLFVFMEESDVEKVLMGKPWSFDKYLVALKRVMRPIEVKGLNFDKASFWVQVHDLLLGSLNMRTASDIIVSSAREVVPGSSDVEEFEGETENEERQQAPFDREEQAQLDDIDGELSRYDQVEIGLKASQGGVGSVVGSTLFLKNLFAQEKPTLHNLTLPRFTRVPRKSSVAHKPLELVLSKRLRKDVDEDSEEANERCKKRAAYSIDLMVEADGQSHRQP